MKKVFVFCLIAALALGGCGVNAEKETVPLCRVVTAISLSDGTRQQNYTAPDQMGAILTYMRLLDLKNKAREDPETAAGSEYHIRLTYSDGTEVTCIQRSDRYFKTPISDWTQIDSQFGAVLGHLMDIMPGG